MVNNIAHRNGHSPGACAFLDAMALLFHKPSRSLRRVFAANYCETSHEAICVSYAWHRATPSVPSFPARRLESRMTQVLNHVLNH